MADTLILHEIAVECRLGVYEWERTNPQTVWIDLEIDVDAARSAAVDDMCATIDYGALVTAIKQLAKQRPYNLLETLGEFVASMVLRDFGTSRVRVRVKKKALPGIDYAAVELERCGVLRPRRRKEVRATARRRSPERAPRATLRRESRE